MQYVLFRVGEKEFKLRMVASAVIALEKQLGGQNPISVLMDGNYPTITATLNILHAALQKYHHGMTLQKVMDLYDEYVENGGSHTDLVVELIDVFRTSGFFPKARTEEGEEEV